MKKIAFAFMVAMLVAAMAIPAFAETDFTVPNEHIKHVSYDEVKPGIVCDVANKGMVNVNTPVIAAGTTEATLWGWVATDVEVKAFSCSVNGGEVKTDAGWMYATEEAVVNTAKGVEGAEYGQRFEIKVPVANGTQVVRAYAEFADGTHELFWIAELTVGEASDFTDAGDTYAAKAPDDGGDDGKGDDSQDDGNKGDDQPTTPPTGDAGVIFAVAAAGIALTAIIKRRVRA